MMGGSSSTRCVSANSEKNKTATRNVVNIPEPSARRCVINQVTQSHVNHDFNNTLFPNILTPSITIPVSSRSHTDRNAQRIWSLLFLSEITSIFNFAPPHSCGPKAPQKLSISIEVRTQFVHKNNDELTINKFPSSIVREGQCRGMLSGAKNKEKNRSLRVSRAASPSAAAYKKKPMYNN